MRERELKLAGLGHNPGGLESLPMRERELKLWGVGVWGLYGCRSPCGSVN